MSPRPLMRLAVWRLGLAAAALVGCTPAAPAPTASPTVTPMPTPTATPIPSPTPTPVPFIHGVDASYLQQIEDAGGRYYQAGEARDAVLERMAP